MRYDTAIEKMADKSVPLVERLRLLTSDTPARAIMHEAADRIAELEAALRATRAIVVEGALVGFNPHDGDWADRLFKNQGAITDLIGYTPADAT